MPISQTQFKPKDISVKGAETPRITNVSVLATTEKAHILITNLEKFTFRSRVDTPIQFAFTATESSTNFITLEAGCSFSDDGIKFSGKTIYFYSSVATTIEILEYYT